MKRVLQTPAARNTRPCPEHSRCPADPGTGMHPENWDRPLIAPSKWPTGDYELCKNPKEVTWATQLCMSIYIYILVNSKPKKTGKYYNNHHQLYQISRGLLFDLFGMTPGWLYMINVSGLKVKFFLDLSNSPNGKTHFQGGFIRWLRTTFSRLERSTRF